MRKTYVPAVLLLLCACLSFGQSRQFKSFYMEGKRCLGSGDSACAVENFKEAFRLNQKAHKFKAEGNFFENYLPRHSLALAYEKTDIIEAQSWVEKSKEALESDVIRRRKKDLAAYHADLERITKAAEAHIAQLRQKYDIALSEAQSLLRANRFDEAKAKYEALVKMDGSRMEGPTGLASIVSARNNYLKGVGIDVERAILRKNWKDAERLLAQMKAVDAGYPGIAALSSSMASEKEKERLAKAASEKAEKEAASLAKVEKPVSRPVVSQPVRTAGNKPDPKAEARKRAAAVKKSVREALLASIDQYRKGYADKALEALQQIPNNDGGTFGSYHWLKGVYLLTSYRQGEQADEALKQQAGQAMAEVARLMPKFEPDAGLYPAYILEFYQETRQ